MLPTLLSILSRWWLLSIFFFKESHETDRVIASPSAALRIDCTKQSRWGWLIASSDEIASSLHSSQWHCRCKHHNSFRIAIHPQENSKKIQKFVESNKLLGKQGGQIKLKQHGRHFNAPFIKDFRVAFTNNSDRCAICYNLPWSSFDEDRKIPGYGETTIEVGSTLEMASTWQAKPLVWRCSWRHDLSRKFVSLLLRKAPISVAFIVPK